MTGTAAAAWVSLLAQGPPGSERGEEFGKTSPIALVVILLLGLATFLLIRSMTKRLRNVPESFGEPGADGDSAAEGAGVDGPERDPASRDSPPAPGDSPGERGATNGPGHAPSDGTHGT